MKGYWNWSRVGLTVIVVFMTLGTPYLLAQTLGTQPVFNTAVPGQTAAQPEGALKNFVNWIGNVVAPIAAGGAIFGAVVAFMSGRTFGRWRRSMFWTGFGTILRAKSCRQQRGWPSSRRSSIS